MTVFRAFSHKEVLDDLKAQVTDGKVFTDKETLQKYSFSTKMTDEDSGLALAYVEAHSTRDIQGTLKIARKYHIPVVPQAQTTSTVVGSEGIEGSLLLSTVKMNRILEISKADSLAVVEPGVINGDLDKAAREQGMFYAPDPGSRPMSGIGGNVATNAGGMSTVKYGATKDNVLGVNVVLADGREIKLGGRTLKQAFGYDLTQLMVGSEGTLGIITKVIVKLLPIPLGTPVMGVAFFDNMTALAKAVTAIRISGVYPTMLEALDANTVAALDRYEDTHYAEDNAAMLIFKLDNGGEASMNVVKKLLAEYSASNVTVTTDPDEQAKLEQLRRDMLPAVFAGQNHIMEDMAVPLSQLAPLMDYIQDLAKRLDVKIYTAGHAGDGNVHPTLVWPKEATEVPENVIIALQEMFKQTLVLGGTISGEHAVGMLKNQWNNAELGEDVDQLQHQIKALFDPMNLLNPKRKIN
ncbi:FAD-binding oxidoreductase [Lactiplantibacillus xiangfangensis]|uniref:Lactate dehydrogenase (Oxidoreductase) n=1 Tax=Lactiplantibacillus xiangfangensis TaxID=942150 RepID=A0A0R2MJ93_9LACO|nr:FAD-linked oxidase C-terminal domain-containing protein [Lactiplantibacillus xiangfangensis]KRO10906.1 lactate dehydrogenase (oxidoreductase) [Lactiplantibacillus xiangfangensis]